MENDLTEQYRNELYEERTIIVDPGQSPKRLDLFLHDRLERISRAKIQAAIKSHAVLVDGKPSKPGWKVMPNQEITLFTPVSEYEQELIPEDIPLDIKYEDDDVLVVYKPPGLVVHPGVGNHSGTLVNGLLYHYQNVTWPQQDNPFKDRPGLVHRIDKDTSGLLVIAKNENALTHLSKQFFDRTIDREYYAIVWGEPDEPKGTISGDIGRNPRHRFLMTVLPEGKGGKHAVTHYEVLEGLYYVSLVKCKLDTGRTHQIRVHMKHIGHTLFNDERYGGHHILKGTPFTKYRQFVENTFKLIPRQALHARSLGFTHPRTGERMYLETDMPEDMRVALEKWRQYVTHKKTDEK